MSYLFNTKPGTAARSTVATAVALSGYTLTAEFSTTVDFASLTTSGTVTYDATPGHIHIDLSASQVDAIKDSYYRIKCVKSGSPTFYVVAGYIDYMDAARSSVSAGMLDGSGYLAESFINFPVVSSSISGYLKPASGIPESDLASSVITKLNTVGGGGGGTVVDATTSVKGVLILTGDLGGTATAPTVPGLALKAPIASPTFTGTVSGISKSMVGLGSVDNTADTAKPVSTAQATAIALKANIASPTFTGTVSGITASMVGLGSVNNTADTAKPVSTAQQTAIDLKYTKPSTGIPETDLTSALQTKLNSGGATVSDATTSTKGIIILAGDLAGTASSPTVPALSLKAPIASPTFTGTVSGITASMVGLGNVNNTADTSKPVSTAQQTAIDVKYTKPGTGIPETDLATAVQTKLNATGGSSTGTAYVRVAIWDGSNYLVNGTAVTSANRVSSTYYKFVGGPDPSTLSLGVINGDEWKAA